MLFKFGINLFLIIYIKWTLVHLVKNFMKKLWKYLKAKIRPLNSGQ